MGHFIEVANIVLSEVKHPLSAEEITQYAFKKGLLKTRGKTPEQSMKARLSTDILKHGDKSLFLRTEAGKFGLRLWLDTRSEYHAPRFKKALLDEDIIIFPASSLSKYVKGRGLHTIPPENRRDLFAELKTMKRREAEEDFTVIQLISCFIVKYANKYLTYKRTARLPENRLHGFYSIPFGGHLNEDDILPLFDMCNATDAQIVLTRELKEEIIISKNQALKMIYKGLLYDDSRDISRQHLGIAYDVLFDSPEFEIGERGFLIDAKFETLDEIEARIDDFENWSWLIVDYERRIK